ncbi:MAG: Xaa-Pro aminopeptidase, partial [Pseudomonadota bacterium]
MHRIFFVAFAAITLPMSALSQARHTPTPLEILPLRDRAALEDQWLEQRLDAVIPAIMRRAEIDMWVLIAREYNEDPVVKTMLPATWMSARRRTVLVFHDNGKTVERFAISRYPIGDVFPARWDPETEPDQWKRLAEAIAERDPKTIAVNASKEFPLADGITASQIDAMATALPAAYRKRLKPDEELAISWLERRIPEQMPVYADMARLAHTLIAEAFSEAVITPGATTTQDVVWHLRQRASDLGLDVWFHPSVSIQRANAGPLKKESEAQADARKA